MNEREEENEKRPEWDRDDDGFNGLGAPFFQGDPEDAVEEAESLMAKVGLQNAELAALRQQLAEARQGFAAKLMTQCHDEIARLEQVNAAQAAELEAANKIAEGASEQSINYYEESLSLKDKLAAQAAELERLRKELDGAETYGAEMTRNWECVCKNNSGPFAQLLREVHERHFAELSTLQSESAAFEKLASDYQDVIARLDGDIDRLREAAEELVNMVGGNCSWQEVFTVIDGRLRAALTTKQEQGK